MSNFIKDLTALPSTKSDLYPAPNSRNYTTAADFNVVTSALSDLRNFVNVVYNVKAYGALGDGTTDDTTAIQAALDAAGSGKGICYFPAGTYIFTNLKITAYTTLLGCGMGQSTILKRKAASTGTAIREKTAAEGNASGASGIWIRNLYVDGNTTTGDGLNIGNQVGGAQLNFLSGLENLFVYNFTSGVGMIINQNAAKCSYLWSNSNATGIKTQGGSGYYDGIWAEGNTTLNLQVQSSDDTFIHVHCEQAGTSAPATGLVKLEGNQNRFFGMSLVQTSNITEAVYIATGAVRNAFYEVMLNTNGFTFSDVIYVQVWASGTGSTDYRIPSLVDGAGSQSNQFYNQSDNSKTRITGGVVYTTDIYNAASGAHVNLTSATAALKSPTAQGIISTDEVTGSKLSYTSNSIIINGTNTTVAGPMVLSGGVTASGSTAIDLSGNTATTKLPTAGIIYPKRTTVADTVYTALSTDYLIAYTSLTAGRTVTIPTAAAGNAGQVYVIKNETSGAFAITIAPASGTVDGAASVATTAVARAPAVRVYSTGAAWFTW